MVEDTETISKTDIASIAKATSAAFASAVAEKPVSATPRILLLHGPNLNLLGTREPEKYGSTTLAQLESHLTERAAKAGFQLDCLQSNHEGVLVDRIHTTRTDGTVACIINAGALTHTSVALRDAFAGASLSFLEVHITNVHAREEFRHHSYLSAIARGIIVGFGVRGYDLALDFITSEHAAR